MRVAVAGVGARGGALDTERGVRAFDAVVGRGVLLLDSVRRAPIGRIGGGRVHVHVRVGLVVRAGGRGVREASGLDLRVLARDQLERQVVLELDRLLQLRQERIVLAAEALALLRRLLLHFANDCCRLQEVHRLQEFLCNKSTYNRSIMLITRL